MALALDFILGDDRPQHKDNLIPWPGALKSFSEALKSFSRALKSFSEALKVRITLVRPLSRYPYVEACYKALFWDLTRPYMALLFKASAAAAAAPFKGFIASFLLRPYNALFWDLISRLQLKPV